MSTHRYWIVVIDNSLPIKIKGDFNCWKTFNEWVSPQIQLNNFSVSYRLGGEEEVYAVVCEKTFTVMCEELACHGNSKVFSMYKLYYGDSF
jgi:hypothetical protein